jgi:lactoylglutathione lyase
MRIEHVAIWTGDLERLREFYEKYFGATAGSRYENPRKQFQSYFLTFDGGARLELMQSPAVTQESMKEGMGGFAHVCRGDWLRASGRRPDSQTPRGWLSGVGRPAAHGGRLLRVCRAGS